MSLLGKSGIGGFDLYGFLRSAPDARVLITMVRAARK